MTRATLGEPSAAARKKLTWGPEQVFLVECENPTPPEPPWIGTVAALRISAPPPPSTRSMCIKAGESQPLGALPTCRTPSSPSCQTVWGGLSRSRAARRSVRPNVGSRTASRTTCPAPTTRNPTLKNLLKPAIPATPKTAEVQTRTRTPLASTGEQQAKRNRYWGDCPSCAHGNRKRKCRCLDTRR